ncbi:MAG: PH domain-containing protein [Clostridia bacterium]|nr:PH domain-containing protein [Clostridia bacterium]
MWQDAEQVIGAQLTPGETAIWTGRPRPGLAFRPYDLPVTVFSLLWLAMAVYITGAAGSMGRGIAPGGFTITKNPFTGRPVFMRPLAIFDLFGFVFIAVGLYLLVGRFFVDARIRQNTYYGVTDKRILIVTGFWGSHFISIPLERIGELNVTRRADGSGTILVGTPGYLPGWRGSSLDEYRYHGYRRIEPPSFDLIDDVLAVRDLIVQAQMRRDDAHGSGRE